MVYLDEKYLQHLFDILDFYDELTEDMKNSDNCYEILSKNRVAFKNLLCRLGAEYYE